MKPSWHVNFGTACLQLKLSLGSYAGVLLGPVDPGVVLCDVIELPDVNDDVIEDVAPVLVIIDDVAPEYDVVPVIRTDVVAEGLIPVLFGGDVLMITVTGGKVPLTVIK